MPKTLEDLFSINDIECFDLKNDPNEMDNLAVDRKANGDLLLGVNAKLTRLIEAEVGEDNGQMFPGERNWAICAVIDTLQCEAGAACLEGDAEALNIPSFVRISVADKTIRGTRPNGESLDTVIGSSTRDEGELLLQGVENSRGWSMAITEATGRMVLTASGDEVAFVVFGACTGVNG